MSDSILPPRDEIAAEELTLAHVRIALRRRVAAARAECDAAVAREADPDPDLRALAETHGPGLIAILDGATREAVFQAAPPLRAMVDRVASGAGALAAFEPAHFEFAAVQSNKITDPKAQRYVQKLKTNTQNERATAAALMNEASAFAASQLLAKPQATEPEPRAILDDVPTAELFAEPAPVPLAKPQAAPEPIEPEPPPEPTPVAEVLPEPAPTPEPEPSAVPAVDATPEPEPDVSALTEPVPEVPQAVALIEPSPEVREAPPEEPVVETPPVPEPTPLVEPPDSKIIAPDGE